MSGERKERKVIMNINVWISACAGMSGTDLNNLHRYFAEPFDLEHHALAGCDRNRRDQAAGDDDHIGFQTAAALGDVIGEPGERGGRILGCAFADKLAVDGQTALDADEIVDVRRSCRPDDGAAVLAILDDQ